MQTNFPESWVCKDSKFIYAAHVELFGLFHLFTLILDEFDYTARVQHVLHTTGYNWVEVELDNISLSRLIRVFY